ncbi:hypothetical protein RIF29_34645 [Crotalaria pallida]|uniref:Uncharacterized protein n=1 Tax=Crotalaria pallida TaxID=3830 RepID=A0AAN9EBS8_CROPI
MYMLWRWRKLMCDEPDFSYPPNAYHLVRQRMIEVLDMQGTNMQFLLKREMTIFINWRTPPDGRVKLNTDGVSKGNPRAHGRLVIVTTLAYVLLLKLSFGEFSLVNLVTLSVKATLVHYLANKDLSLLVRCHILEIPDNTLRGLLASDYRKATALRSIVIS